MPTWIRVRDEATGHEYDVEARALPRPGLTPVEGVEPVDGPGAQPRPAKVRVGKDGRFTPPKTADEPGQPASDGGTAEPLPEPGGRQPAPDQVATGGGAQPTDQQQAPADQPAVTTPKRSKR